MSQIVPPRSSQETRPRVVVGVDGSAGSRSALEQAWLRAARSGAVLDVVAVLPAQHAWTRPAPEVQRTEEALADTEIRARAMVDEIVAEGLAGTVEVRVQAVPGSPAGVLVEAAEGAAALVVGSRGRGIVRSAVLGSVALHCVTHARCPVEVVHATPPADASGIVVGVDGSAESSGALRVAVDEAARLGTTVRVVAAWEVGDMWSDMYALTGPEKNAVRTRLEQAVAAAVADAGDEFSAGTGSEPPHHGRTSSRALRRTCCSPLRRAHSCWSSAAGAGRHPRPAAGVGGPPMCRARALSGAGGPAAAGGRPGARRGGAGAGAHVSRAITRTAVSGR